MSRRLFLLALMLLTGLGWTRSVPRTAEAQVLPASGLYVSPPVSPVSFSGDLRDLPRSPLTRPLHEVPEGDQEPPAAAPLNPSPRIDPVLQPPPHGAGPAAAEGTTAPSLNFAGIPFTFDLPPDTNGAVGPNHYIQMVNPSFAVYNKSGALLSGPTDINTLWSGTGTICEEDNVGDPIVVYDQAADRWLLSQFAIVNFPDAPWDECIAISKTGDPVSGGWFVYSFPTPAFPDYPKFGVWPDAYYMSTDEVGTTDGVFAFDRAKMLAGLPATFQHFGVDNLAVDENHPGTLILPSDWDGMTAPPTGSPNPFMRSVDGAVWGGSDRLEIFNFHVDFSVPANSTFGVGVSHAPNTTLLTAPFDANLCGLSRDCVPQPGPANGLDTLSDRLMWRLQYRNLTALDGQEHLVVNQTVAVGDSPNHAGIRWYELTKSGGAPFSIRQQGTYSPDANHRFMGSAAMNGSDDIALGYSVSSSTVFPSIRYTGRVAADPLGTLTQPETSLIAGSGSQTCDRLPPVGCNRWGDYSAMVVDPVDDCTFWYTTEYIDTSATWQTRIGSFRISNCVNLTYQSAVAAPGITVTGITAVGSTLITVSPSAVPRISLACNPSTVAAGSTGSICVATVTDSNGVPLNGLSGATVTWTTSDTSNSSLLPCLVNVPGNISTTASPNMPQITPNTPCQVPTQQIPGQSGTFRNGQATALLVASPAAHPETVTVSASLGVLVPPSFACLVAPNLPPGFGSTTTPFAPISGAGLPGVSGCGTANPVGFPGLASALSTTGAGLTGIVTLPNRTSASTIVNIGGSGLPILIAGAEPNTPLHLNRGCNQVTSTTTVATPMGNIDGLVSPLTAVISIWQFSDSTKQFQVGFFSDPNAPTDFTVTGGAPSGSGVVGATAAPGTSGNQTTETYFICVNQAATIASG